MKKPNTLLELLEVLKDEIMDSDVVTTSSSFMKLLFDDGQELELNRHEMELVLNSTSTVERLFEALNEPIDCGVEIHGATLPSGATDALEDKFGLVEAF